MGPGVGILGPDTTGATVAGGDRDRDSDEVCNESTIGRRQLPLVTSQAPLPVGHYAAQWTHGLQHTFDLLLWKRV